MSSSDRAPKVPSYRKHKPSGRGVVTINGKDFYLGKWGTKASRAEYDRLIGEWLAGGRQMPTVDGSAPITVAEVIVSFWKFAKSYYQKNGRPTGEVEEYRQVIRILRHLYGPTPAQNFGPLALKVVRQRMVDADLSRGVVNQRIGRVKRIFKWAVAEELLLPGVLQAIQAVDGLRRGRTAARETEPIKPVPDAVVKATLPHMSEIVADMVRLQRLCGCRPAEVCMVRPCDVDISGDVWVYRPESHKTEHHGRERAICIGPQGQDILRPYLLREKTAYCFSPTESETRRRAQVHAARKTPLSCGNRPGTNRRRKPKRKPGDRYDTNTYRRAIHRAVDAANKDRKKQIAEMGVELELLPRWSPNRLRHTAATEIRKTFGLEAAQVALGHSQADVTQIYAEKDLTLAAEVARKIG